MRTSVYFMIVGALIMGVFAEQIARFMVDYDVIVEHMVTLTYILCFSLPLMGIEFSMAGALRGAGDTQFPMRVTVFSILVSRITIPWILVQIGADVFWLYALSMLDFLIKSSLNLVRFRSKTWMSNAPKVSASTG